MRTIFLPAIIYLHSTALYAESQYRGFFGVTLNNQKYAWYEEKIPSTTSETVYENTTFKKEGSAIVEELYTVKVFSGDFKPKFYSFVRKEVGKKIEYTGASNKDEFIIKAITGNNSSVDKEKFTISNNFIFNSLLTFKLIQDLQKNKEMTLFSYTTLLEDSHQTKFTPVKAVFVKDKSLEETLVGDDGKTYKVPCQSFIYKQYKDSQTTEPLLSGIICIGNKGEMISFKDPENGISIIPIPEKLARVFFK